MAEECALQLGVIQWIRGRKGLGASGKGQRFLMVGVDYKEFSTDLGDV